MWLTAPRPTSVSVRSGPTRLTGRDAELDAIVDVLRRRPAAVLIEGEPGMGRTRLLAEIGRRKEFDGGRVLTGACQPLREPFPYGPILEALRAVGDGPLGPLSPVAGVLRPLLPELAEALPPRPEPLADPVAERHRVFRAVRELLRRVRAGARADRRPPVGRRGHPRPHAVPRRRDAAGAGGRRHLPVRDRRPSRPARRTVPDRPGRPLRARRARRARRHGGAPARRRNPRTAPRHRRVRGEAARVHRRDPVRGRRNPAGAAGSGRAAAGRRSPLRPAAGEPRSPGAAAGSRHRTAGDAARARGPAGRRGRGARCRRRSRRARRAGRALRRHPPHGAARRVVRRRARRSRRRQVRLPAPVGAQGGLRHGERTRTRVAARAGDPRARRAAVPAAHPAGPALPRRGARRPVAALRRSGRRRGDHPRRDVPRDRPAAVGAGRTRPGAVRHRARGRAS